MALAAVPMLVFLSVAHGTSAARGRHAPSAKCAPSSHTLLADPQAQVYSAPVDIDGDISLRACIHGQRRSFLVTPCTSSEGINPGECVKNEHVTLAGTDVACEESFGSLGKYPFEGHAHEWFVVVRDLRTGRVLRKVPTGVPLKPEPRYVGVGNLVALVLKSDGSVAWITEDYERTAAAAHGTPEEPPYFDVYAADKSGTRLLAAGTSIDPSSLALSTGGTRIGSYPSSAPGKTVYWTQGGRPAAALLN